MSEEGQPMLPQHTVMKLIWHGVVEIGSGLEKATTWSITGVAAITGLLVSNLHSLTAVVAIGRVRAVIILFTISIVAGASSKVVGMALTAGLRATRELEETLGTEQNQSLMRQMQIAPRQFVCDVSEPFLWPLSTLMRWSGERGAADYLSAEKTFVRLFCAQLYVNAIHGLTAVAGLLTLALSM